MTKNQIKIGRGGEHVWIDLKLDATRDVSREHLQLRRDAGTGRFYIKDLSKLGTTVNGRTLPPSIVVENGGEIDKNIEAPLPDKARIGLAGVLFLEFRAVKD
jgi:predicted component of type VI protein secretion system